LREKVCPLARRLIEHSNWAAKEEVSKKNKQRENVPAGQEGELAYGAEAMQHVTTAS
jgi:hypothetical protein